MTDVTQGTKMTLCKARSCVCKEAGEPEKIQGFLLHLGLHRANGARVQQLTQTEIMNEPASPIHRRRMVRDICGAGWSLNYSFLFHRIMIIVYIKRKLVYINSNLNPLLWCWRIPDIRNAVKQTLSHARFTAQ